MVWRADRPAPVRIAGVLRNIPEEIQNANAELMKQGR